MREILLEVAAEIIGSNWNTEPAIECLVNEYEVPEAEAIAIAEKAYYAINGPINTWEV